jgi:hypothetical protein
LRVAALYECEFSNWFVFGLCEVLSAITNGKINKTKGNERKNKTKDIGKRRYEMKNESSKKN